jgi:pimeloyl-ACP methyl ester carboxylesterase
MSRFILPLLIGIAVLPGQTTASAAESLHCARGARADSVVTKHATLAGVPAIVRVPVSITKPPIILWHGFGPPASEQALMDALPLDDVPALKVYVGLPLFGARAPVAEADSLAKRQSEDYGLRVFEPVVLGAAKELRAVVDALRKQQCMAGNEPIGLFGFSAGGAAVLLALEQHDVLIRAAVTVNAPVSLTASIDALERATKHAYSWTPASRELAKRSDAIQRAKEIAHGNPPPAILLFHGADDTVVTPQGAESLQRALQPFYAHTPERLKLVIAPNVSHDWTAPQTLQSLQAAVEDWFLRY